MTLKDGVYLLLLVLLGAVSTCDRGRGLVPVPGSAPPGVQRVEVSFAPGTRLRCVEPGDLTDGMNCEVWEFNAPRAARRADPGAYDHE